VDAEGNPWTGQGKPHSKNTGAPIQTALADAVDLWPTPNSRDHKGAPGRGCQARGGHQSSLPAEVGGSLNPQFVEWLMGFPIGYTDLGHSETP